ncbi:hypothetical protein BVG16_11675 [Paenibacillus selenitireducens]|uniref:DUF1885 domain-containing protein n=1 Tax=Paenibacillus selenitireducens TaxID=1324314 RepID=A0A1T2XFD2_9BACL|nr:DUF1885 family protein [Paenibacillus selenitireducens]OPA78522.1 hypothetical protein BVG16_11675 [Paenibacillus selenitireducens]
MSQSAFITFVEGSAVPAMSLEEVKQSLMHYKEQTTLTGQQLDWDYSEAAFPYTVETRVGEEQQWFYLKGTLPRYKYIVFGVGSNVEEDKERHYIQVVLPEDATHGDKSKGNELCKFIARKNKAELKMFNGRTLYFNPRK